MNIPFEPTWFNYTINVHLILEYLAFFIAYRYYAFLKKNTTDPISSSNRLQIILGAAIGAFLGSRIIGLLENPTIIFKLNLVQLVNAKTIMGGLFGGLLGVEITKKIIGEKHSSGDLFTFPIILGLFIGRIGCFLSGTNEFTYGKETSFFMAMNLGDNKLRHPTSLYELLFLTLLFIFLKNYAQKNKESGTVFKFFMVSYFGFRFMIEFLKPNVFYILGISTIQLLCITCWLYYYKFIIKNIKNAC